MVSAYFAQGRELLTGNPTAGQLHRLRLATKRLRYTLELFRPCYGTGLETRLAELRKLQGLLGDLNDTAATERLLSTTMPDSPQKTTVRNFLAERARKQAHEFRRHWSEVFDGPGREAWWTGYLGK